MTGEERSLESTRQASRDRTKTGVEAVGNAPPESAEPAEPRPAPAPQRLSRDLFEPRSIFGAIGVVAVLCLFGFGIAAVDEWVKESSTFDVGTAYEVSETVSFTPASGWEIDPKGTIPGAVVKATKNGVTLKVLSFTLTPKDTIQSFAKVFRDSDDQNGMYATVTALKPFTSTSGANGLTWDAHGPKDASETWMVVDGKNGKNLAQMSADGPAANWAGVAPDLEAMAKSLTVSAPKGSETP